MYNITGDQTTLRWLLNGTSVATFTQNDSAGVRKVNKSSSYRIISFITKNSVKNTSTNGESVDFASSLIAQPLWNHDTDMQQPFSVSCESDIGSNNAVIITSHHEIEGM